MSVDLTNDLDSYRGSSAFLDEEFLAEESPVEIQPHFNLGEPIRFISQECGPFDRRSPISVPIWVAVFLEKHGKCTIKPPAWLSVVELKLKLREERERGTTTFASLPEYMLQVALILLNREYLTIEYLGGPVARKQMEALINEILMVRRAKMTEGLKQMDFATSVVDISNMTSVERATVRPQTTVIMDTLRELWAIRNDLIGEEQRGT